MRRNISLGHKTGRTRVLSLTFSLSEVCIRTGYISGGASYADRQKEDSAVGRP